MNIFVWWRGWVASWSPSSSSIFIFHSFIHSKPPNVQIRFVPKFITQECAKINRNKGGGLHELIGTKKKILSNDTKWFECVCVCVYGCHTGFFNWSQMFTLIIHPMN